MGKISPLTIAVIIVILAILIPVSIMIAKLSITGKAISEAGEQELPRFNFPVKNTIFAVLLAVTVIALVFTARRIAYLKSAPPEPEDYGPEIKQAKARADVKNILNTYIDSALENDKTQTEIIEDLAGAGWPRDYVSRYVKHYLEEMS